VPVSAEASRLPAVETAVKVEQGYTYADVRCGDCLASSVAACSRAPVNALLASKAVIAYCT
jgi:hypothetical protein